MTDKADGVGARPSDQALASQAQGLGPSGFDPSRYADAIEYAKAAYAKAIEAHVTFVVVDRLVMRSVIEAAEMAIADRPGEVG